MGRNQIPYFLKNDNFQSTTVISLNNDDTVTTLDDIVNTLITFLYL